MSKAKNIYADMDPIEEIRAVREKISRRFKTASDMCAYLRKHYPDDPPTPEPQPKSRRAPAKTRGNDRPAMRQRKAAAHA